MPRIVPLFGLLSVACSSWQTDGDYFFVRNDGADMPVWVKGDTGSKVLGVWLAGGPSDPVALVHGDATEQIEESMGMVYWDQRGAGSAQGNADPASFTMDQYVEDTDQVVDLVQQMYEPDQIWLFGHSWGGTLGTAYLLDPDRQAKIAGFFDVDGNHDQIRVFPMKIAWLRAYADARISEGVDVAHWTEVRDWCDTDPPITIDNFAQWDEYVTDTNAAFHDPDVYFDISFDMLFRSGESLPAFQFVNRGATEGYVYRDESVFAEHSYTEQMGDITVPVALLWGQEDGIVPLPAGEAAYEAFGTAPEDKALITFEKSAHFAFLEEPDAFAGAVTDFVAAH